VDEKFSLHSEQVEPSLRVHITVPVRTGISDEVMNYEISKKTITGTFTYSGSARL